VPLVCVGCASRSDEVIRELRSPGGVYTALVFGNASSSRQPFRYHHVKATVTSNERVWRELPIHTSGWMDSGFDARFDGIEWSADNVLRFAALSSSSPAVSSRLDIQNLSSRPVACLRVVVRDVVLVFDLKPADNVSLNTTTGPGNATVDIAAAELSSAGSITIQASKDFSWDKPREGFRYRVVIRDSGIEVHAEQ
jgi:hypothetical protein